MSQENVEIVRRGFDAFTDGDLERCRCYDIDAGMSSSA